MDYYHSFPPIGLLSSFVNPCKSFGQSHEWELSQNPRPDRLVRHRLQWSVPELTSAGIKRQALCGT